MPTDTKGYHVIKLEALRTFSVVAEAGNIKDAGARLLRTPSAISMTLSQLERELGGPLFESDRKNALTNLGQFVRQVAEVMIRDHDRAIEIIQAYAQDRAGQLRIASVPSVATHLLPALLQRFVAARQKIEVELVDTDSPQVLRLVATGQADFGICGVPKDVSTFVFHPLFEDGFKVVCSTASPLAALARPVEWHDLAEVDLIQNEASRAISAPEFAAIAQTARLTVRNMASLLAMVQAGGGITLLPAMACVTLPIGVVALDLNDIGVRRVVGSVNRAGVAESPLARAFQHHLKIEAPALLQALGVAAF